STNDGRVHAEVPLPKAWLPEEAPPTAAARANQVPRPLGTVLSDPPRQQFLLATANHVVALPLSAFKLPAEKSLWISMQFPDRCPVGETLELDLGLKVDDLTTQLSKGPKGMALAGQTLRWTPSAEDVGDHDIEITVSTSEVKHIQSWSTRVHRPT